MTDEPNEQHDDRRTATDELTTPEPVPQHAEWDLTVQARYDEDSELTTTIVYAVAEAEGVEPQSIRNPPLYDVVDTDALETAYFDSRKQTCAQDPASSTEFMYCGFRVIVQSNGWIFVYERLDE